MLSRSISLPETIILMLSRKSMRAVRIAWPPWMRHRMMLDAGERPLPRHRDGCPRHACRRRSVLAPRHAHPAGKTPQGDGLRRSARAGSRTVAAGAWRRARCHCRSGSPAGDGGNPEIAGQALSPVPCDAARRISCRRTGRQGGMRCVSCRIYFQARSLALFGIVSCVCRIAKMLMVDAVLHYPISCKQELAERVGLQACTG